MKDLIRYSLFLLFVLGLSTASTAQSHVPKAIRAIKPSKIATTENSTQDQNLQKKKSIKSADMEVAYIQKAVRLTRRYIADRPVQKGFTKDHRRTLSIAIDSGQLSIEELKKARRALSTIK